MRAPSFAPLILVTVALCSCIERPEQSQRHSVRAGRPRLPDVLLTTPPSPHHLVNAIFDNQIELVGYDVTPEAPSRGEHVSVDVYYRAIEDVPDDWQIFVHVEDQARVLPRFNLDHWPAGDRLRTNTWHKGDFVKDQYTFSFPATVSNLEIWTGFYQDNTRLPLTAVGSGQTDNVNRVRIGGIAAR